MGNILNHINRFCRFFQPPSIGTILLYHRIADVRDDPHHLSVSEVHFSEHIEWLASNTHVVSLSTLVKNLKNGVILPRTVCITFDDGYADNFYSALPILKQFQVPATVFITSRMIGKKNPFYWDENTNKKDQGRALNKVELIKLAKEPLIEIGSHTSTHPHLRARSIMDQEKEISESKIQLENIIKKRIKGFSYPFGTKRDYNKKTIDLIKTAGYEYACANFSGKVTRFSNPFEFPRIIIRNWTIEVFEHKIRQKT